MNYSPTMKPDNNKKTIAMTLGPERPIHHTYEGIEYNPDASTGTSHTLGLVTYQW